MQAVEISEEELIIQAQEDPRHFGQIYDRHFPEIFRFILKRTNDKEASADLSQQVFLKGMLAIKSYKYQGLPFSAYLYRIAINECNEYFRLSKRTRFVSAEDDHWQNLITEVNDEIAVDQSDLLKKVFQRLESDEIQLLELRFFEMMPFREIGFLLDITENLAKVRTYRLLDKMKKWMEA